MKLTTLGGGVHHITKIMVIGFARVDRVLILCGDKIRSQTKIFLYLFQLVVAKEPVHEISLFEATAIYRSVALDVSINVKFMSPNFDFS
ncbi:TPA: hypothetical protein RUX41_000469 [Aeromonas dhakensis]|nr:hypothetical protein [Aeromonas dhakensis]